VKGEESWGTRRGKWARNPPRTGTKKRQGNGVKEKQGRVWSMRKRPATLRSIKFELSRRPTIKSKKRIKGPARPRQDKVGKQRGWGMSQRI